jgi:hypothetical protein
MEDYKVKKATANMNDELVKELAAISRAMNVEKSRGNTEITLPFIISDEAIEYLKTLHYVIDDNTIKNIKGRGHGGIE